MADDWWVFADLYVIFYLIYCCADEVVVSMLTLGDLRMAISEQAESEQQRILLIVNAYIAGKGVKIKGEVPNTIKQAGIELAQGFVKGEMLAGRTEGVVTSKSSKAGDVSVSKNYANGADGQAMGQHEMIALALIEPYVVKGLPLFVKVSR